MGTKVFASARGFSACTPSDATLVTCKALYVGTAGNIALSTSSDTAAVTFTAVPAGSIIPVELLNGRVMSTNTTASNIVLLNW